MEGRRSGDATWKEGRGLDLEVRIEEVQKGAARAMEACSGGGERDYCTEKGMALVISIFSFYFIDGKFVQGITKYGK